MSNAANPAIGEPQTPIHGPDGCHAAIILGADVDCLHNGVRHENNSTGLPARRSTAQMPLTISPMARTSLDPTLQPS